MDRKARKQAMAKYLDAEGLRHLLEMLRQALAGKQDAGSAVTMAQVDAAIRAAVTSAIEEAY